MKPLILLLATACATFAVTPFDIRLRQLNSTATGEVVHTLPYPATGTYCTVIYDIATKLPFAAAPWDSTISYDAVSESMGIDQTWMETNYIPRAEMEADWAQVTDLDAREDALETQIGDKLNTSAFTWTNLPGKPSTFTPSAHNQAWSTITSTPTTLSGYGISDGVTSSSLSSTLSSYATTSALTSGLSGKFNVPAGTTAQYVRGDGTLGALPAPGTGTVTSIGITSSNLTVSGSPITSSGNIAVSLPSVGTAGTYGAVTTDAQGRVVSGKRMETYSGTTNGSGVVTVTFGTAYSVAPNIQANLINGADNQNLRITAISTTGFTVLARTRTDVVGLLPTWANASGLAVDILITEK